MQMVISIDLSNEAFFPPRPEVSRILKDLSERFEEGTEPTKILDVNGNTVGTIRYYK